MVEKKSNTNLTELLLGCVSQPDPMLSMLEWLCVRLMEAKISAKIGADNNPNTRQNGTATVPATVHGGSTPVWGQSI